jgi:DNA-directed RNA polymerase subunit RPC12/RpoP
MTVPGYQCHACWSTFREEQTCEPQEKAEVKCPTCQSNNVQKVDLPDSWVDRVFGGIRFG